MHSLSDALIARPGSLQDLINLISLSFSNLGMLTLVLAGLSLATLYFTKPHLSSFVPFWRTRTITNRLITTLQIDSYSQRYYDCFIFILVRCFKGVGWKEDKWFIGIVGQWYRIGNTFNQMLHDIVVFVESIQNPPASTDTKKPEPDVLAEEWERRGDERKAVSDYANAAVYYAKAAKASQSEFEGALLWEKSALCYDMDKNEGKSHEAWINAVDAFKRAGKPGRAAQCITKLIGRTSLGVEARHDFMLKAITLYDSDNDSRALDIREQLAESYAGLHQYKNALAQFNAIHAKRPSQRTLFFSCVCAYMSHDPSFDRIRRGLLDKEYYKKIVDKLQNSGELDIGEVALAPAWLAQVQRESLLL